LIRGELFKFSEYLQYATLVRIIQAIQTLFHLMLVIGDILNMSVRVFPGKELLLPQLINQYLEVANE
jgi:hypothetical protein